MAVSSSLTLLKALRRMLLDDSPASKLKDINYRAPKLRFLARNGRKDEYQQSELSRKWDIHPLPQNCLTCSRVHGHRRTPYSIDDLARRSVSAAMSGLATLLDFTLMQVGTA